AAGLAIVLGDARIDLLALGEPLRALVVAIAGKIGAADEGRNLGAVDLHLDAAIVHLGDDPRHHGALAQGIAGFGIRIAAELLDAQRDALLLDIDVEHLGLDHVATVVALERILARLAVVEVGEVHHAVDIAVEADEQAELGLVLDLALDDRPDRELLGEGFPRIGERLLEAERDAALVGID